MPPSEWPGSHEGQESIQRLLDRLREGVHREICFQRPLLLANERENLF